MMLFLTSPKIQITTERILLKLLLNLIFEHQIKLELSSGGQLIPPA